MVPVSTLSTCQLWHAQEIKLFQATACTSCPRHRSFYLIVCTLLATAVNNSTMKCRLATIIMRLCVRRQFVMSLSSYCFRLWSHRRVLLFAVYADCALCKGERHESLWEVLNAKTIIKLCAHAQSDVAFVLAVTKHVARGRHTAFSMILFRVQCRKCFEFQLFS